MWDSSSFRKILLITILLLSFSLPIPVQAQGIVYGDNVPANTVVDSDLILIGQNVSIEGTVNGNVFILGNQVQVDGQVDGSLIVIGQNLAVGGEVSGGTYALGLTLELAPGAALERDLYVLSVGLSSGQDTTIQRDLFAMGLDASLNGSVGRDLHTAIGPIQLYNGLMRLLGFEELTLDLRFELPLPAPEAPPEGEETPTSRLRLPHAPRARLAGPAAPPYSSFDWVDWGIGLAREWIVLSLFGILAFWLARRPLEASSEPVLTRPWRTGASGLLVLVVALNLFVLAALVGALVFSLGLALNYLGLWQLSLALWLAVYALLALACVILWFFIVYGTKIVAVYALFSWLSGKITPDHWAKIVALLIGLLVYALLRSVPMVGWVVGILVTAMGMGTAWSAYRTSQKASRIKKTEEVKPASKKKKAAKS
jgi:hypothetical protein